MADEMEKRLLHAEWRLDQHEEEARELRDKLLTLSSEMRSNHNQIMAAIGELKDNRARSEGAAEARLEDAQKQRDRLKIVAVFISLLALFGFGGWFADTANGEGLKKVLVQKPIEIRAKFQLEEAG